MSAMSAPFSRNPNGLPNWGLLAALLCNKESSRCFYREIPYTIKGIKLKPFRHINGFAAAGEAFHPLHECVRIDVDLIFDVDKCT